MHSIAQFIKNGNSVKRMRLVKIVLSSVCMKNMLFFAYIHRILSKALPGNRFFVKMSPFCRKTHKSEMPALRFFLLHFFLSGFFLVSIYLSFVWRVPRPYPSRGIRNPASPIRFLSVDFPVISDLSRTVFSAKKRMTAAILLIFSSLLCNGNGVSFFARLSFKLILAE